MTGRLTVTVTSLLMLGACTEDVAKVAPRDRRLGPQRCTGLPGPTNTFAPVLQRPFDGQYAVTTLFDHSGRAAAGPDKTLTYCGLELLGTTAGLTSYSFALPRNTPVLAAADGEVIAAGVQSPFACPLTRRTVDDQLAVEIRHDGLGGVGYLTRSTHLSKVLVQAGEHVVQGQRIGLSGQTGCAVAPELSFEVLQLTSTRTGRPVAVDPYGWDGPSPDPWAANERGARSRYLWIDGEAPTLNPRTP